MNADGLLKSGLWLSSVVLTTAITIYNHNSSKSFRNVTNNLSLKTSSISVDLR